VPNTNSAKKRVRQNATRRSLNKWRKGRIKEQTDTFLEALASHDVSAAEASFKKACQVLDKIAGTGTIHKNTAARRKSRMSKRLKALQSA
jgi:small subunit ribosomal protein S20